MTKNGEISIEVTEKKREKEIIKGKIEEDEIILNIIKFLN